MRNKFFYIYLFLLLFLYEKLLAQCGLVSPISLQIEKMTTWLGYLALAWIALAVVFAAYRFVTSEGNPSEVARIKKMLTFALLGGALLLGGRQIIFLIIGC